MYIICIYVSINTHINTENEMPPFAPMNHKKVSGSLALRAEYDTLAAEKASLVYRWLVGLPDVVFFKANGRKSHRRKNSIQREDFFWGQISRNRNIISRMVS